MQLRAKAAASSAAASARRPTRAIAPRRAPTARVRAAVAVESPTSGAAQDAAAFTSHIVEEEAKYVLQTYARPADVVFVRGEGCMLFDAAGRPYLDMAAGIAVNALGHGDSRWYEALSRQAGILTHTSNLFHTVPQVGGGFWVVGSGGWLGCWLCVSGVRMGGGQQHHQLLLSSSNTTSSRMQQHR